MSQEEFNVKADRIAIIVLFLLLIGGIALFVSTRRDPEPLAPPSDMKLVSGNPRKEWVSVFHDAKRNMVCYVTNQGGIWCTDDINIEDQAHMLAYRDAGLP